MSNHCEQRFFYIKGVVGAVGGWIMRFFDGSADLPVLGRKIVELMHINYLPVDLLPYKMFDPPAYGYGFGLGSSVLINVAESEKPGSVGEFGWDGAAKTYYWVDPQEDIIGLLMAQSMIQFEVPDVDFRVLTYQALVD